MPRIQLNALGRALHGFLTEDMPRIRGLSRHTVLAYRDAFKLLLHFLENHLGRSAATFDFPDLAPERLLAFLRHLETERHNSAVTRNLRLAALHAFARYAAAQHSEHLDLCQRILAIPAKRASKRTVEYLDDAEMEALLRAPDTATAAGRRDRAILLVFYNTGARVQELLDLRPCDLQLNRPFQVQLRGKGGKQRCCPLWQKTVPPLREVLHDSGVAAFAEAPLFRNRQGRPLTRSGVRYIVQKHARAAAQVVPSLAKKRVHPHVLRHTAATHWLQAGVDLVTISRLLGHASTATTCIYATVDMQAKRAAVEQATPVASIDPAVAAWRSDATMLNMLDAV